MMAVLRFKDIYRPAILTRTKTSTLRAKVPGGIRSGAIVQIASSYAKPPWALAEITTVEPVRLDELDDDAARADGFASVNELRVALASLYPGITSLHRITFECVEPGIEPAG